MSHIGLHKIICLNSSFFRQFDPRTFQSQASHNRFSSNCRHCCFRNQQVPYPLLFKRNYFFPGFCLGLLKLADKYSVDRLEAACCKALTFTATPSYKSIKNILDTGSDRTEPADKAAVTDSHTSSEKSSHALTRGADYYRR